MDAAKDLRQTTKSLNALQKQVLADLASVKVQIMEDMKKQKVQRDELLHVLGFTAYLKKAQGGDQEALIDLLQQFKLNLTTAVRNQIATATGMPKTLLSSIANYADIVTDANVSQENFKGKRKSYRS